MTVSCFTCGKTCNAQRDLDQHLSATGHWRGLECDQCDLLFFDQHSLNSHIKTEHGYNFICETCNNSFIDSTALNQHRAVVHDTLECRYCQGSKFKNQTQLEKHMRRRHDFACEICGKFSRYQKQHDQHVRQHETELPHKCPYCEGSYKEDTLLQSHIAIAHPWKCDKCSTHFDTQFAHDQHRSQEHKSAKLPCEYCTKKLSNEAALQSHVAACHSHKCKKCAMVFDSATSLEQHTTQTHSLKCFKCTQNFGDVETRLTHFWKAHSFKCCGLSFENDVILQEHKELAHFRSCEACSKTFRSRAAFDYHCSVVHNNACEDCKEKFTSIAELLSHRTAKHAVQQSSPPILPRLSGLRCTKCLEELSSAQELLNHDEKMHRHICQKCNGMFDNHLALKTHVSAHVLACPTCNMQCADAKSLIHHHITSHMAKCKLCEAAFENNHSLHIHMGTLHATREIFSCGHCDKKFPSAAILKQHFSSEHTFKCEACPGAIFITSAARDSHIASTHHSASESGSDTSFETSHDHFSSEKNPAPKSFPSTKSFFQPPTTIPMPAIYGQPAYIPLQRSTITTTTTKPSTKPKSNPTFQCDECPNTLFTTRAAYDQHMQFSPFHGAPALKCFECNISCTNQIALLTHIESKPHNVRWVLSMISTD
ncbi:hypothetical protein ACMFMG_004463 [Clarireedia jacksonii]